jgi:hypothetical protein
MDSCNLHAFSIHIEKGEHLTAMLNQIFSCSSEKAAGEANKSVCHI